MSSNADRLTAADRAAMQSRRTAARATDPPVWVVIGDHQGEGVSPDRADRLRAAVACALPALREAGATAVTIHATTPRREAP